jgi:hypothetical protein
MERYTYSRLTLRNNSFPDCMSSNRHLTTRFTPGEGTATNTVFASAGTPWPSNVPLHPTTTTSGAMKTTIRGCIMTRHYHPLLRLRTLSNSSNSSRDFRILQNEHRAHPGHYSEVRRGRVSRLRKRIRGSC